MSKYEQRALWASVAVAVAGAVAAVAIQDGEAFSRSGALIVVIAVVFGSLEIRKRLAKSYEFIDDHLRRNRPRNLAQAVEKGLDEQTAEDIVARAESETRADATAQIDEASKRVLRVEVGLLIVGTFIWGFGDLPFDAWFGCAS